MSVCLRVAYVCVKLQHVAPPCVDFFSFDKFSEKSRTSLAMQWSGLHTSPRGGMGCIPGQGTKVPHTGGK